MDSTSTTPEPVNAAEYARDAVRCIRASLLRTLSRRFPETPMPDIAAAISKQEKLEDLLRWYEAAAVAHTMEHLRKAISPPAAPKPADSSSPWLERVFFQNQEKVSPQDLLPYAGQYIAWSWDGSHIVASDPNEAELRQKVAQAGLDPQRVVYDFVDDGSMSSM